MMYDSKMKYQKYHTVGAVLKSNRIVVERGKIDTLTYKYMIALSWFNKVTSIKKKVEGLY